MIAWFAANLGTILVAALVLLMVVGIVRVMLKDKRQGKTSCGAGCVGCPHAAACGGHRHAPNK